MPRKHNVTKRPILADPRFGDQTVSKFINAIMIQGKKSTAEQIVYGALDLIQDRTKEEPVKVFRAAMENVRPVIEVKSRRVGGSTYQVPVEVRAERRNALAMRWIITYARARSEKSMTEKLAGELIDAVKKREDTHKMAEANKAFAHYRW